MTQNEFFQKLVPFMEAANAPAEMLEVARHIQDAAIARAERAAEAKAVKAVLDNTIKARISEYLEGGESVTAREVSELFNGEISSSKASYVLRSMVEEGTIRCEGQSPKVYRK